MDRRRLECFVALAEDLHFSRAANRAGISQPGLSQQLRKLESQLQVQLVQRTKRHVALTTAGAAFLEEARKILLNMAAATEIAQRIGSGQVGTLKIGTTPSALFIVMPEIVVRFHATLPDIDLDIRQMSTDEQVEALRNGDIHLGLLHAPLGDTALQSNLLLEKPFMAVLSENNPKSQLPVLRLSDLVDETLILFPRGVSPQDYDDIIARCRHEGFSPRRIIETSPAQSIVAMAACNLGVGFVASEVQHYDRPFATYRTLEEGGPVLRIAAALPRTSPDPMAVKFLEAAYEALRQRF